MTGKVSQSIQFDKTIAKFLIDILTQTVEL